MSLTLGDARRLIGGYTPGGFEFLDAMNQVQQRFYDDGMYDGLAAKLVITGGTSSGFVTPPPWVESLLGFQAEHGQPCPLYGEYHEWQELGIGYIDPSTMTMIGIISMGDGYFVDTDIATEGTLRFKIYDSADAGKTIRIGGLGTVNSITGREIFDSTGQRGIELTTVDPTADTTQTFSDLSPPFGTLQIPEDMKGMSELYVVNSGTATLLGRYNPGDSRPCRMRYKLGVTTQNLLGFCKLRFIPARSDTDVLRPSNLGAFKLGLMALQKEDSLNFYGENGSLAIWANAKKLLMNQLKSKRGANKPAFPIMGLNRGMIMAPPTVS